MTRPTGEDAMSSEHVEVLERLRDRWAVPDERVALDAAIAALSAPQSGDWVLVPREASSEMLTAAIDAHLGFEGEDEVDAVWAAMISAAEQFGATAGHAVQDVGDGAEGGSRAPTRPTHFSGMFPRQDDPASSSFSHQAVDVGQFRPAVATHQLACRKRVRDCREGLLPTDNLPIYLEELAEANRLLDVVDRAAQQPAAVDGVMVRTALRNLPQYISKSGLVGPDMHSAMQCFEVLRDALAQQPAPTPPVGVPVDVVREYLDARACYEAATRPPNSHARAPVLKHDDPDARRLREARVALDNAIVLAQQPAAPVLAKHQPCGCVICTCEDEQQCQGCGAKHCGNRADHPPYVGQQPAAVDEADAGDAEIEALRAEVAAWEGLHASEVQLRQRWQARAERLAEALRGLVAYVRETAHHNAPAAAAARAALRDHDQEGKDG